MAVANQAYSVEFVVVASEDLFLDGKVRQLLRVGKGHSYPCQMQRTQIFRCLWRHYAKHHGLRKEDLVFTFVDELQADDTPESVHLMPHDQIIVSHRSSQTAITEQLQVHDRFSSCFTKLIDDGNFADITFNVGESKQPVLAHKAILYSRSEYFYAMLRPGGVGRTDIASIDVPNHEVATFRQMLDFLYTDKVRGLEELDVNDVISLIVLADEYLLDELKHLAGKEVLKHLNEHSIAKIMLLSTKYNLPTLRDACIRFIRSNKSSLSHNVEFLKEIESSPEIGLLLFEALPSIDDNANESTDVPNKRIRLSDTAFIPTSLPSNGQTGTEGNISSPSNGE